VFAFCIVAAGAVGCYIGGHASARFGATAAAGAVACVVSDLALPHALAARMLLHALFACSWLPACVVCRLLFCCRCCCCCWLLLLFEFHWATSTLRCHCCSLSCLLMVVLVVSHNSHCRRASRCSRFAGAELLVLSCVLVYWFVDFQEKQQR